eukprot:scaffold41083_cov191-Amphora_coffeaeformis.AAC.8
MGCEFQLQSIYDHIAIRLRYSSIKSKTGWNHCPHASVSFSSIPPKGVDSAMRTGLSRVAA